jgi:hypothetical protein
MTQEHPITPPPELVKQWRAAASNVPASLSTDPGGRRDYVDFIATQAARWGADQELEACCKLLELSDSNAREFLTAARRPKPPSLKIQALCHLESFAGSIETLGMDSDLIRRALESLPD